MDGVVLWFGGLAFDGRLWQNVQLLGICGMFLYMLDIAIFLLGGNWLRNLDKFGVFLLVASFEWQIWIRWRPLPSQHVVFWQPLMLGT